MFLLDKKVYDLARVGLVRAACPQGLADIGENLRRDVAIRVDRNRDGRGAIKAIGYKPRGVVVAGAAVRNRMLEEGRVHGYVFVERGALDISAAEQVSAGALLAKLHSLVTASVIGRREPVPTQKLPVIVAVWPFEERLIYALDGVEYAQRYRLDAVARSLRLGERLRLGPPVRACGVDQVGEGHMPPVDNGFQQGGFGQARGNEQTYTRGASNSELMTQTVRNWTNVNKAVENYLASIRNGQHKPPAAAPMFSPVTITPAGKIGAGLAARGIDVYDFVRWSAAEQGRKVESLIPAREGVRSLTARAGVAGLPAGA